MSISYVPEVSVTQFVCVCVCVRVCVCVCVFVCQIKTKDRVDSMKEKVPIPLDGIRTCTSGIRAHRASDYTTRAGTPCVSSNKHFGHSPTSSIVKHKHALRNTPTPICGTGTVTGRLQAPPLSRKRCVRERRKIELTAWGKKVSIPLNGIRNCTSGIRPIVLPIKPREQARLTSVQTSDTHPPAVCFRACVHMCVWLAFAPYIVL